LKQNLLAFASNQNPEQALRTALIIVFGLRHVWSPVREAGHVGPGFPGFKDFQDFNFRIDLANFIPFQTSS